MPDVCHSLPRHTHSLPISAPSCLRPSTFDLRPCCGLARSCVTCGWRLAGGRLCVGWVLAIVWSMIDIKRQGSGSGVSSLFGEVQVESAVSSNRFIEFVHFRGRDFSLIDD